MLRLLVGILSVTATVLLAWYTAAFPLDASASPGDRLHYHNVVSIFAILAVLSSITLLVLDSLDRRSSNRERKQERVEREKSNRQIADLHLAKFSVDGSASVAQAAQTANGAATFAGPPVKLRYAIMLLAKRYRNFAKSVDPKTQNVLTTFWAENPFKELDDIKLRIQAYLHFDTVSAAEWLPNTPERILKIANNLEAESRRIPEDALL